MPNTYALIESKTLASATASVTFTSIPQTFTDLVLKYSSRQGAENAHNIRFNGDSGANYAHLMLGGDGSSVSSGTTTGANQIVARGINPSGATANIFGNVEFYIPNYANTTKYKSVTVDGVNENAANEIYCGLVTGLWNSTSAITSILIEARDGNLAQYSVFQLYGIKNS
jgi:hypothetical protein